MNYTVNGKNYTADDGYVFCHKISGACFKKLRLAKNDRIENYDVIPEPVPQEEEATEE
ncbi:MAG: hypothetical protein MJ147_00840 [Clostridia bacterium]|nr:hypothetical protein [Clostridia bacterium]